MIYKMGQFDLCGGKCLWFMSEESIDLWDDNDEQLWLHVVGIHTIDYWLYGHAKC